MERTFGDWLVQEGFLLLQIYCEMLVLVEVAAFEVQVSFLGWSIWRWRRPRVLASTAQVGNPGRMHGLGFGYHSLVGNFCMYPLMFWQLSTAIHLLVVRLLPTAHHSFNGIAVMGCSMLRFEDMWIGNMYAARVTSFLHDAHPRGSRFRG